jgi:hypothetical protein
MNINEITMPAGTALSHGDIFTICTGVLCTRYKVRRVRATVRGVVAQLVEVAGSLALDPMVAYYDERLRAGDLPKVARAKACKKFGNVSRAQFYRRKAAR